MALRHARLQARLFGVAGMRRDGRRRFPVPSSHGGDGVVGELRLVPHERA